MTVDSDDLFEAAKYIAIARGYLQNPDAASKIGSHASHTKNVKDRYLLMRNNGVFLIKEFLLEQVKGGLLVAGKINIEDASKEAKQEAAYLWAKSKGFKVPDNREDGCTWWFFIVFGFIFYILPGIILLIAKRWASKKYELEMDALVTKWFDAGCPKIDY